MPWLVATISQFSRLRLRVFLCSAFALSFPLYVCVCVCQISLCSLFMIARTWKQLRCPLADKWIRKLWYIYTMEYYSTIKKNTFESVLMRWMKLEPIIQSELSQTEKHQYSILMHIYIEFRKMATMALYTRQQKRHRCKEQTFGLCGRGRGWDDLKE